MTSEHTIGSVNNANGICGFAASVYMAAQKDPGRMPTIASGNLARRTLVEIAHFLQTLKNNNRRLFDEIQNFTRAFGSDYKKFSIDDYIMLCNFSVNVTERHIYKTGGYDIAMTPDAVAAYLKHAWDIDAQVRRIQSSGGGPGNCILGLCGKHGLYYKVKQTVKRQNKYSNLKHWVYRHNGQIYSYGQTYASLAAFNAAVKENYTIGWEIS